MKTIPSLITSLTTTLIALCLLTLPLNIQAHDGDSDEKKMKSKDAVSIFLIEPKNDQIVAQTFTVKFGIKGFGIAPAGVKKHNTGHHHLLIDTETLPDLTKMLPATDKIKHFGGGQTETELTLSAGKHTLQLLLGDYMHKPHATPILSKKITIIVK